MKSKKFTLLVAAMLAFLTPSLGEAQSVPTQQWTPLPGFSLYSIMNGDTLTEELIGEGYTHAADIVSTDALSLPEGKSALVTLLVIIAYSGTIEAGTFEPVATEYFRCIDWMDAEFQASGFQCWQLTAPK